MKRKTFIIKVSSLLLLLSGTTAGIHAQSESMPFVQEGKQWNYVDDDGNPFSYAIDGDTAINGKEFKNVYYQTAAERRYQCAVREEGKFVYSVPNGYNDERVLCIFDVREYVEQSSANNMTVYKVSRFAPVRSVTGRLHKVYSADITYKDGQRLVYDSRIWYEGVGAPESNHLLPFFETEDNHSNEFRSGDFLNCSVNGKVIFTDDDKLNFVEDYYDKQCATPTIAYNNGRLVFGCDTPDVKYVYEINCSDNCSGRGGEVSLSRTYEIRVHATLDGYYDSDVATAAIGWRNGRPVMEGFSSVTLDDDGSCDVNGDGTVDVADIAKVIDSMAK